MSDLHLNSVEDRIAAWLKHQQSEDKKKDHPYSITLAREFGCEAYPLAERLKELLEKKTGHAWAIFDHALIDKIIEERNISKEILENLGRRSSFLDGLIGSLSSHWQGEADIYEIVLNTIHSLAQGGNCILIGRGAAVVTQDLDDCYHFRLEAPMEFRVNSLVKRRGMGAKEAKKMIEEGQKQRDGFVNRLLNCKLADSQYYHLVFNNEKIGVESMAKMILAFLEQEGR